MKSKFFPALVLSATILGSISARADLPACGLKGKQSARIAHCKKVMDELGEKSERRVIYVSKDHRNEPITGIGASAGLIWSLVAQSEDQTQLWLNSMTQELWVLVSNDGAAIENPATPCQTDPASKLSLKGLQFALPEETQWQLAVDQGVNYVLTAVYGTPAMQSATGVIPGDNGSIVCVSGSTIKK